MFHIDVVLAQLEALLAVLLRLVLQLLYDIVVLSFARRADVPGLAPDVLGLIMPAQGLRGKHWRVQSGVYRTVSLHFVCLMVADVAFLASMVRVRQRHLEVLLRPAKDLMDCFLSFAIL